MAALTIDHGVRRHAVQVHRNDGIDRIYQGYRVRPAGLGSLRRGQNIGDIGGQLDQYRHRRRGFAPACHHLDIFRHLADGGAHASLGHAMGAAKVELHTIGAGVFHRRQYFLPGRLLARNHERYEDSAVGPVPLDLFDLGEINV